MKIFTFENNYYDLYDFLRQIDKIENIQKRIKYFL